MQLVFLWNAARGSKLETVYNEIMRLGVKGSKRKKTYCFARYQGDNKKGRDYLWEASRSRRKNPINIQIRNSVLLEKELRLKNNKPRR